MFSSHLNCSSSSTTLIRSVDMSLLLDWLSTEQLQLLLFNRFSLCFFLYLFLFLASSLLELDELLLEKVNKGLLLFFRTIFCLLEFFSESFSWLFGPSGGLSDNVGYILPIWKSSHRLGAFVQSPAKVWRYYE